MRVLRIPLGVVRGILAGRQLIGTAACWLGRGFVRRCDRRGDLLPCGRLSMWSARSEARTYDIDNHQAAATMERPTTHTR